MRRWRSILRVTGWLLVTIWMPTGQAAPKPDKASKTWQLDCHFYDPERMVITLPGDSEPTTFWYLLYTVTNDTGQDVDFYPAFELVTNTCQVVRGGDRIHPLVVDAIRVRHKKQYTFFVDPLKATGRLLQGEDNARTSAAVFRNFDPAADRFTIYAAGLSGEVVRLRNPAFDADAPESETNSRFFTLRKSLGITYDLPGDPKTRKLATATRVKMEWVMR
jgi:hypothetical protein